MDKTESKQSSSQAMKAAACPILEDLAKENRASEGISNVIILRQLSDDGRFERTISALPGEVTVLMSDESGILEPFYCALTGKQSNVAVTMRLGNRDLEKSEIHVVGSADYLFSKSSVADVLSLAGIFSSQHLQVLSSLGLDSEINNYVYNLSPSASRRLAILSSFYVRSRVLLFDKPFLGVEPSWVSTIAKFISSQTELGKRIVFVTGLENLPSFWKNNSLVHVETSDGRLRKSGTWIEAETREHVLQIRTMLQKNVDGSEEDSLIITRPQILPRSKSISTGSVQSEQILNPVVASQSASSSLSKVAIDLAASPEKQEKTEEDRQQKLHTRALSGKLTKVSGLHRIQRTSFFRLFREVKELFMSSIHPSIFGDSTLMANRHAQFRKRMEIQRFFVLFVLLLLLISSIVLILIVQRNS